MDEHRELKSYERFQRKVFLSAQEGNNDPEPIHVPYGRCSRHPEQVISNGMFDGVCGICEAIQDGMFDC